MEMQIHDVSNALVYVTEHLNIDVVFKLIREYNDFTSPIVNVENILTYILANNISLYNAEAWTPETGMFKTRIVAGAAKRYVMKLREKETTEINEFVESLKANTNAYIDILVSSLPETFTRNDTTEMLATCIDNIHFIKYGDDVCGSTRPIWILVRAGFVELLTYCKNAILTFLKGGRTPKSIIDDVINTITLQTSELHL